MKIYSKLIVFTLIIMGIYFLPKEADAASPPAGYTLYDVSTYAQFKAAMAASSSVKKYIRLNNDIVIGFANGATVSTGGVSTEGLSITSDTIIDGSGSTGTNKYALLFGYTGVDGYYNNAYPLRTSATNITMTYRNLKIGNSTYRNFFNGGLIYPTVSVGSKLNLNLVVENVDFEISGTAGTLANSYNSDGSTLTFRGKNTIRNGSDGFFLISYFRNVVVDEGSETILSGKGTKENSVFSGEHGSKSVDITVKPTASLYIKSDQKGLATADILNLHFMDNSTFKYEITANSNSDSVHYLNTIGSIEADLGTNSSVTFDSVKDGALSWGVAADLVFSVSNPKKLSFSKKDTTAPLFAGMPLIVTKGDTTTYQSSTLAPNQTVTSDIVKYKGANVLAVEPSTIGVKQAWVYEKVISIADVSSEASVAAGKSDLLLGKTVTFNDPNPESPASMTYKLTNTKLTSDSEPISSDTSQTAVDNYQNSLAQGTTTSDTGYTVNNLMASDYYFYSQATALVPYQTAYNSYSTKNISEWVENKVTVPVGIFVEFPGEFNFSNAMMGPFESAQGVITNLSNTQVTITPLSFSTSISEYQLVSSIGAGSPHSAVLMLNMKSPLTSDFQPINVLDTFSSRSMTLGPYTSSDKNSGYFYLTGTYRGPLDGVKKGTHLLRFEVSH